MRALTSAELMGEYFDRLLGCKVCGDPQPCTYEVSLLGEEDGEVAESSVLKLLHFCEGCATSLISADWATLSRRATRTREA
jgi:hypothetical protein